MGEEWDISPSGLVVPAGLIRPRLTAVDLFCGAGGFSLGILAAGFEVVAAADNDPAATVTYLINLGAAHVDMRFVSDEAEDRLTAYLEKHVMYEAEGVIGVRCVSGSNRQAAWGPPGWTGVPVFWFGDISRLSGAELLAPTGIAPGDLDLVVGGPPCQGFSVMGRRRAGDVRNSLVFEFARLIVEMRPKTMCMENVPGILSMTTPDGAGVIDEFSRILERGDFGEFEAIQRILTGERKMLRRGAKAAKRRRGQDSHAQVSLDLPGDGR